MSGNTWGEVSDQVIDYYFDIQFASPNAVTLSVLTARSHGLLLAGVGALAAVGLVFVRKRR